jgi:hypothetical protein
VSSILRPGCYQKIGSVCEGGEMQMETGHALHPLCYMLLSLSLQLPVQVVALLVEPLWLFGCRAD